MSLSKIGFSAENVAKADEVVEFTKEQKDELVTWINKPQLLALLDSANFYRKPSMLYRESGDNIACSVLPLIEPHWIPHEPKPPACALEMDPPSPEEEPEKPKTPKEPRMPRGWD